MIHILSTSHARPGKTPVVPPLQDKAGWTLNVCIERETLTFMDKRL